jgi:putative addiction module component (TIGR02574 family)
VAFAQKIPLLPKTHSWLKISTEANLTMWNMHPLLKVDISQLSVAERIQLAEDLWDSIILTTPDAIMLSDAQTQELDRRLELQRQNPERGSTWEEVKHRLSSSQ